MEMFAFRTVILASVLACLISGKIFLSEPNLYYECEKNDTIVVTGKSNATYGSVHAVGTTTTGRNSTCSVQKQDKNNSEVAFIISNCKATSTITIYVMEEKQVTDYTVLGGKGLAIYELMCKGIQKGGTNVTQVLNLTDGDTITVQPHYQLDVNLSLEVTNNNNKSLKSSSIVRIGEELHIIISGNNGFIFAAQSCKATDAATLRHEKNLTHNGMTFDTSVISNFTDLRNYSGPSTRVKIEAILYAFHFKDSDSIVITCTITVCETDDDKCPLKQTGNVRRRRATGVEPYTQSLQTILRVVDIERKVETNNGGSEASGASGGSNLWIVLMISCVLFGIFQFCT